MTAIDLGGAALFGDGILLSGRRLYVVLGDINQIAVVQLSPDLASGVVTGMLTRPALDFPTTIARFGDALYAVNARFNVAPTPTTDYSVVQVPLNALNPAKGHLRRH